MSLRALRGLSRVVVGLCGLASVSACQEERADTAIVLDIVVDPAVGNVVPEYVELDWYDGNRGIFRGRRVPASGTLRAQPPYASIVLEIGSVGADASLVRRAVVRGYVGMEERLFGAGRWDVRPGRYDLHALALGTERFPDSDNDGMPNVFDVCSGLGTADDFAGCLAPAVDAAVTDGTDGGVGPRDGGATDAGGRD